MAPNNLKLDEIGYWSEIKLDILKKYAGAYTTILEKKGFHHAYIDGFAGAGQHISRRTGEFVAGSPLNALNVRPAFKEIHLIDMDSARAGELRRISQDLPDVHVYEGDCNKILLDQVFPRVRYEDYCRALCILDPYGLQLDWTVIATAGKMKSVEIFLNFPVMHMNRNVLRRNPDKALDRDSELMTRFWGDSSWKDAAYSAAGNLFGEPEKEDNEALAEAFRKRLKEAAGFDRVPRPIPMRNQNGATIYYLFFASQVDVAENIVLDIFNSYRQFGA